MARTVGSDGERTRQRILNAAIPLLAQLGYAAVSMRMIAEEVGVNPSAIYNHFPNKQSILLAIMTSTLDAFLEECEELDLSKLTPPEQLEKICQLHIRYYTNRPDEIFVCYMELRSLEPDNFKAIEAKRKTYEDTVRKIIVDGGKSGDFVVEDTHAAAMSVIGSLVGINTWYRKSGRLSRRKITAIYTAMALRTVGYSKVPEHV